MSPMPEEIPTPFPPSPGPDVTDITAEQERQNIVTAAYRECVIAEAKKKIACEALFKLSPTPDEIMAAIETWKVQ